MQTQIGKTVFFLRFLCCCCFVFISVSVTVITERGNEWGIAIRVERRWDSTNQKIIATAVRKPLIVQNARNTFASTAEL